MSTPTRPTRHGTYPWSAAPRFGFTTWPSTTEISSWPGRELLEHPVERHCRVRGRVLAWLLAEICRLLIS